jgi:hypothetical protein
MALVANMYPGSFLGGSKVVLSGSLAGNGTTDPVAADYEGIPGAVWAQGATGIYTLTLPGKGALNIEAVQVSVLGPNNAGVIKLAFHTATNETTRVLSFLCVDVTLATGAMAAADLAVGEKLSVHVTVKNTLIKNA